MDKQLPKIGTALIIFNEQNQILLGERTYNPEGWCAPGGHIEFLESYADCAKREAIEEVGCEVENVEFLTIGENIFNEKGFHTISVYVTCTIKSGQMPKNMEPHKCAGWKWFDLDNLPTNFAFNYEPVLKNNCAVLREHINKSHLTLVAA